MMVGYQLLFNLALEERQQVSLDVIRNGMGGLQHATRHLNVEEEKYVGLP